MTDLATVTITIRKNHAYTFLFRLGTAPHEFNERPDGLAELVFRDWEHPACHEFHVDGIPFTGFHSGGESFEPHRMCGDGNSPEEIYCDREGHPYFVADEATGEPNALSSDAVREYLRFERECRARLAGDVTDRSAQPA
jgi:hypothetical protein